VVDCHDCRCNQNLAPGGNVTQHSPLQSVQSTVTVTLTKYDLSTFDTATSTAFVAALNGIATFVLAVRFNWLSLLLA